MSMRIPQNKFDMYVVRICPRHHTRNLYTQIKYNTPKMIINTMYQRNDIPAISYLVYIHYKFVLGIILGIYIPKLYDIPKINIIHHEYDIPQDGIHI